MSAATERGRAPTTTSRAAAHTRRASGWPAKGVHEAYRADVRNPIRLERVAMVSDLHPLSQAPPVAIHRMNMKYIRSYLNWRVHLFRVKQANER
ncbi:hypothetical protein ADJ70_07075 [Olsenella sp. oral taxon 807]|uniref:hypothetical protein n=1 Tax=Olsenella sp. oral taxon 807 TaxID=712411 RepID=UPI000679F629|nr:hypothetical protein [Olsenella sp. oral taxon 807]AKT48758.1 hypothetical protein ADJ70_07075 [Olsenella sp. oral taxon 807]